MTPSSLDEAVDLIAMPLFTAAKLALEQQEFNPLFVLLTHDGALPLDGGFSSQEEKDEVLLSVRFAAAAAQRAGAGLWGIITVADTYCRDLDLNLLARMRGETVEEVKRSTLQQLPEEDHPAWSMGEALLIRMETYIGDWEVLQRYTRSGSDIVWREMQEQRGVSETIGRFTSLLPPLPSSVHGSMPS